LAAQRSKNAACKVGGGFKISEFQECVGVWDSDFGKEALIAKFDGVGLGSLEVRQDLQARGIETLGE